MPAHPQPTDAETQLIRWLDRIAQSQLDSRAREIDAVKSVAEAERRKQQVRQKILALIGGLPDYTGPLNARVTGRVEKRGYTIEHVIFESLPRFYVTANFYRPNQPGRHPAVLISLGHWDDGKVAEQLTAANLALKGFVALAYDGIGQGERIQAYDRRVGETLGGWSTELHLQAGAPSLLIGDSFARYQIWDSKRALDYLVSRPEVDPERIGCTGCSGDGAITTYIAALDPRVKAAAPACSIPSKACRTSLPPASTRPTTSSYSLPSRGSSSPPSRTSSRSRACARSMTRPGAGTGFMAPRIAWTGPWARENTARHSRCENGFTSG
jgi:hypothetical protein